MTHPDLDYFDLMPLDELGEYAARNPHMEAAYDWYIARRAVRDAFLDLAEEMDERHETIMDVYDIANERLDGYESGYDLGHKHGLAGIGFNRDADHG